MQGVIPEELQYSVFSSFSENIQALQLRVFL